MSDTETNRKIEELRNSLTEKLGELHRRATHTKSVMTPSTYLNSPWLRVGVGFAIGYVLAGRGRDAQRRDDLVSDLVRSALVAAASALAGRILAASTASRAAGDDIR